MCVCVCVLWAGVCITVAMYICTGELLWVPREMAVEGVASLRMVVGAGVLIWGPDVLVIGCRSLSSGVYGLVGHVREDGAVFSVFSVFRFRFEAVGFVINRVVRRRIGIALAITK